MEDYRRNNFINNKSAVVVAPMAVIENDTSNHAAANGTISSSTESSDSVEPPKQPFNVNNKDFNETDSNQSIERDSIDVCSVLNQNTANNVPLYDSRGVNLNSNSNKTASTPVHSRAQTTNVDDKGSSIDKQCNGDKESILCDENHEEHSSNGNIENKYDDDRSTEFNGVCKKSHSNDGITIERLDNRDTIERINNSSNDIDVSLKSDVIETNQTVTVPASATLIVQNSSEDCISSSDTISSTHNSIDVKPIKCPSNQSQAASESDKIGCKDNETKEISHNFDEKDQTAKKSTAMCDDDDSLKQPLIGQRSYGSNPTVYSAIERPIVPRSKGNEEIDTDEKCDSQQKRVAYNEYVNLLCDTDKGGIFTKNSKRNANDEESRPLLRQSMSCDEGPTNQNIQRRTNSRPRSIVKSPSTQNFSSNSSEKFDRKPRLSIQCSGNDPERPVLHVQFLQHNNESKESVKGNLFNYPNSPTNGDHFSYQNSGPPYESGDKHPIDLINQMPARGILRQSRMRDSISASSSDSSSSSSDSSSSDDVSQFAEATPPDGAYSQPVAYFLHSFDVIF